jgi:hypothetical protein
MKCRRRDQSRQPLGALAAPPSLQEAAAVMKHLASIPSDVHSEEAFDGLRELWGQCSRRIQPRGARPQSSLADGKTEREHNH